MKTILVKDKKEASKIAAEIICKEINKKRDLVLGLATGKTMIPVYKEITKLSKRQKIDFREVKTFNLDEYLGLNEKDKESFKTFMNKNLFGKINIQEKNINFLDGKNKGIKKECKDYENKIKKLGGIDLQILGIGKNGHIAFNEPESSFSSVTRKVKLTDQTRKDDSIFFKDKKTPEYALTVGLKTIMNSKKIMLIALGKEKTEIVKRFFQTKITKKVPATILKKHKDFTFIIDKEAYKGMK
ncbi:MAG: glucosamine-6-phosphate deaminase [Nanoarchaeota archaeon]|mgnify:CR=1 FL=1